MSVFVSVITDFPSFERPPQWSLDAIPHGAGPRQRKGEAREGNHPIAGSKATESGDTRAEVEDFALKRRGAL